MGASTTLNSGTQPFSTGLVKGLRFFDATTIVMGSMIGSGIFIVSADVARQVRSPGLFLLAWIISSVMTIIGAVTYGELAGMIPKAGGQYVYLCEAFGPVFGFLYGWTLFLVIQTGTIAAVAVAFAKFLGVLYPAISPDNHLFNLGSPHFFGHSLALTLSTQQLTAIGSLLFLSIVNIFGLRPGAWVQNIFTTLKVGTLLGLVALGLWWGAHHTVVRNQSAGYWTGVHWDLATLTALSVALVGPLFSSDAWNNVTFTGAEVTNPKRNLPLSMFVGTTVVCSLYLACNWIYLRVLPFFGSPHGSNVFERGIQFAADDRVATAAIQSILNGRGAGLMAAAIVISTFGCMNGMTLSGARVYYAMAKDRLFFSSVARVSSKYRTPAISLVVQAIWACILTLSGTYSQLLDYVIFAVVLFYIMTIVGVFRLRKTRPDAPRPYRAWGYPVLPVIYLALALFLEWALLTHKGRYSLAGLCIVGLGLPVYYLWRWHDKRVAPSS